MPAEIITFIERPWAPWLAGLLFALGIGHIAVVVFLERLRSHMILGPKVGQDSETKAVPPWLMGVGERLFFTIAVGVELSGAGVAMMTWLVIKLASNWNRVGREDTRKGITEDERILLPIRWSLSAALAGLLSMTFALLGGLICMGKLWW